MSNSKSRPQIINIESIKMQGQRQQFPVTDLPSPNTLSARRKKKKLSKTNEQVIQESYEDLLSYIDGVDGRVQGIIETYEAQFLSAYKEHIKRVREEMEGIKRRSLNSASSQSSYMERVEVLEKQLVIYREDTLKMFEKLTKKDKEISALSSSLKEAQGTVREQEAKIFRLLKKNKEGEVQFLKVKEQSQIDSQNVEKMYKRFSKSENKHYPELSRPELKKAKKQLELRPYSTQVQGNRQKNMSLRLDSQLSKVKGRDNSDVTWIKEKLEEKVGQSNFVPVNTVIDLFAEKKMSESDTKRDAVSSFRKARTNYMTKMETRRSNCLQVDSEVILRSKEMADNNDLKQILKNCIEEVRKDMTRRTKGPSLNFFKENGPKTYTQFKKVDNFALLELLLSNEGITKGLFQLIFDRPS